MIRTLHLVLVALAALLTALVSAPAAAQAATRYTNTTDSTTNGINETATPCTTPFTRTFAVGTSYTVSNVQIGVMMAHSYRGDLRMYLVSPSGMRVQLMVGQSGNGADNFNVLFADSGASGIVSYTANVTAAASTVVPPFGSTFRPDIALSGFNGVNSAGTWTLEICDQYNADSGTFYQADLYLTGPGADLSLAKSLLTASPVNGGAAVFRLTVTSAASSTQTATGVQVRDVLPAGFAFVSASGTGSYDPASGIWSAGSLAPGASASIDLTGTVVASAGASFANTAEIIASSAPDPDSTPDNGATGEDDYASAVLTVGGSRTAGIAPTLTCAAGSVLFDWTGRTWTAGSTDNSYALGTLGNIRFQLANPGSWLSNASFGGQSPVLQTVLHGGTSDRSLIELVNMPGRTSEVTSTITLPAQMAGAQFKLFDVDFGSAQFADRVQVVGRLNGVDVIPQLTNGVANYVVGNSAYGDAASDNGSANGNVTVTFTSAIDTIVIRYGNHSLAPTDPGQQAIGLHDITLCNPAAASLDVTKVSQVLSDPVSGTTNPKAIPGAIMQYCITIGNAGTATATSIAATDNLPAGIAYVAGSLLSGAACNTAATAEDDDTTGTDDTDAVGASHSGGTISLVAPSLAAGTGFAVVFRAQVN